MINYKPQPGIALVKLIPRYSGIQAPEKKWDSITQGEIIAVGDDHDATYMGIDAIYMGIPILKYEYLVGKIGYWEEFKDSVRLQDNYAFIKISDIVGTSDKE